MKKIQFDLKFEISKTDFVTSVFPLLSQMWVHIYHERRERDTQRHRHTTTLTQIDNHTPTHNPRDMQMKVLSPPK